MTASKRRSITDRPDDCVRIGGILLACSSHNRSREDSPVLADVDGTVAVRRAVERFASTLSEVIVVIGGHETAVRRSLAGLDVTFVHDATGGKEGNTTAVNCGAVVGTNRGWDAAVVAPGEFAHVQPETIERLVSAYVTDDVSIVAPLYNGAVGHPTLFDARHFDRLATESNIHSDRQRLVESENATAVVTDDPGVCTPASPENNS
ncbi:nucleotidyltransferase family protein [Halocatena halophila]|uniref:nucleotidyltransferase family protein n=1 Tax=Halocatena halophila TaxID=2814576 RepID=UPI002ED38197